MAGETRPPTPQGIPLQLAQALAAQAAHAAISNVPDIYSEGVGVQVGFNTINLLLNRSYGAAGNPNPNFALVGIVRMSPQQAKVLQAALANSLKSYEENFGEIHVPDDVLAKVSAMMEK